MISQQNLEVIKQLKADFRQKWPVAVEREIRLLNKRLHELNEMDYLMGKTTLEGEIAMRARSYTANMVAGPLLGDGCKLARPWGRTDTKIER